MRRTLYRLRGLPRLTSRTITDSDTLEKKLVRFRAQGYALDLEENEVGVNGIGVPVFNGLGELAAAISVAGPSNRLRKKTLNQMAEDVIAAADAISAALGSGEWPDHSDSRRRQ
jgi:DNA-binding IclR family transcriptional regulator